MSHRPAAPRRSAATALVFAALLAAVPAQAKTTGVSDDPAVQSGPCYDALVDKNAATPTTAPNRELGAACEAEHGDVDKAWARVIRLWGSDSVDLPDYGSYRAADAPPEGTVPPWLAWAGLLLTYAVLGTPLRAAARLAYGPRSAGALVDVVACLIVRALIVAVLIALLALPFLIAAGGLALVLLLVVGRPRVPASDAANRASEVAGSLARHLAELINDGLGAAAGLVALALFAQHSRALFVAGLLLALVASAGPVIAARRALRSTRWGEAVARALLAAAIGDVVALAPPVAGWLAGVPDAALAVPLIFAAATLAASLRPAVPSASPAG